MKIVDFEDHQSYVHTFTLLPMLILLAEVNRSIITDTKNQTNSTESTETTAEISHNFSISANCNIIVRLIYVIALKCLYFYKKDIKNKCLSGSAE